MDSVGISADTGRILTDWDHIQQSISKIIRTAVGSCVLARDFGSGVPDAVDARMTQANILALYRAAAEAIYAEEPRFLPVQARIERAGPDGRITLSIGGYEMPRGHLGDRTIRQPRRVAVYLPSVLI
ncbi:GPW/gp25 family protein [Pannonibacter sp. P2PFMT1]|uniref:GPW/gp25 family protein n=1 Tax=Pannonibacter sp. P2PFMT1 TaxID=2003582 RepID=UPI0016466BFE|nr:GPW/gp25 family protein [Pannonibacter sp. P2PFMT1]